MVTKADVIHKIQSSLTDTLLKPEYRNVSKRHKYYGHCYVASETIYHLAKMFQLGNFRPQNNRDSNGVSHWWLIDDENNIIDITKTQYTDTGLTPPYDNDVGRGFLTKAPSKRALILIRLLTSSFKWRQ